MDNNFYSVADRSHVTLDDEFLFPENPQQYNDILKFSNAVDCCAKNCIIAGGSEDCIDMNRNCDGIHILNCRLSPYGKQGFTIKGGSKNITIENTLFTINPSNVEIELGNYSEQSDEPPTNINLINVRRLDGGAVRVKCLNACTCTVNVINCENVKVYKPWWVKLGFFSIYCYLRKKNIIK